MVAPESDGVLGKRVRKRVRVQTASSLVSSAVGEEQEGKGTSSQGRKRTSKRALTAVTRTEVAVKVSSGDVAVTGSAADLAMPGGRSGGNELDGTFRILPQSYFNEDALVLAPRLLGKHLRHGEVVLRITEVEAYRPGDTACHGRFNTPRTKPLFGPAGHAYVYRCRFHNLLNVVADAEGVGAAVLIRAAEPVSGLEIIQERRGMATDKPTLLDGPGKAGWKSWKVHLLRAFWRGPVWASIMHRPKMWRLRGGLQSPTQSG